MTNKYKTIIWDWNGTLIDDVWLAVEVMEQMLIHRNLKALSLDYYRQVFDFPVKDYYAKIGFDFSKESFEIVGTEFITRYNDRHFECALRPYAIECLTKINESKIDQFILSARNHKQLSEELEFFNIHQHFKTFSGLSHNYAHGKIELGQQLIENQNIQSESTLMIGDTTHDFEVAQALGIDCILIEGGHHSKNRLQKCGVKVIKDLKELVETGF